MTLFDDKFTNLFWDGEVSGTTPDAQGDYYLVTDAQQDHNYMQERIADSISAALTSNSDFMILYGGVISAGAGGTVSISEGVVKGKDSNGNKRIFKIPALTNVAIPSGWNDGRQIWVTAKYDFKLSAATRDHKLGTNYHYQLEDTYMGDSSGYVSTSTDDLFAAADPAGTATILGKFTMTGVTFADLSSGVRTSLPTPTFQTLAVNGAITAGSAVINGALSGITTLSLSGILTSTNTTDGGSGVGAIVTSGGIYSAKKIYSAGTVTGNSATTAAIYGVSVSSVGVYGASTTGEGVRGLVSGVGTGVKGEANTAGAYGVYASSTSGTALYVNGTSTFSADATINGITVGRGGGNVSNSTAVGYQALLANTTGTYGTGVGYRTLYNIDDASATYNTGIGVYAGALISNGSNLTNAIQGTFLGAWTRASANGNTNEIVIGYNAVGNGSNSVTLGNTSITKTILQGNIGIGTTPTYKLDVAVEITNALTVGMRTTINQIVTSSGSYNLHGELRYATTKISSGQTNSGAMRGAYYNVMRNYLQTNDAGTLVNLRGLEVVYGHFNQDSSAPATTYVYGLVLQGYAATGTITNLRDLMIPNRVNGGTVTNHYAIYQEDVDAKNYFGGNVGIGITNPDSKVGIYDAYSTTITNNISGASQVNMAVMSSDSYAINKGGIIGLGGQYNAGAYAVFGAIGAFKHDATGGQAGGYLSLYSRANGAGLSERMRINSAGSVLIGTATDRGVLTIGGSDANPPALGSSTGTQFACLTGSSRGLIIGSNSSGHVWLQAQRVDSYAFGYNMLLQPTTGSVLIGATSLIGSEKLHVAGSIYSTGAIAAPTSTNTINGLIINSGALSGITTAIAANTITNTSSTLLTSCLTPNTTTNGAYSYIGENYRIQNKISTGITNFGSSRAILSANARNYISTGDAGTLAELTGFCNVYGHYNTDASAPVTTDVYGIQLIPQAKTGTIINLYDIHIVTKAAGGAVTNHYAIYQQDTAAKNYFGGSVLIGATSPVGSEKLHVAGDIYSTGALTITPTSNQIVLGTTRTITITAPTPATASRIHTIPDVGAAANFVMSEGAQTINGVKTFGSFPITPSSAPTTDYQAANKKYVDDNFVGLTGNQAISGVKTFSNTTEATSTTAGGTIVSGGLAVAKKIYSGQIVAYSNVDSTYAIFARGDSSGIACQGIMGESAKSHGVTGETDATSASYSGVYGRGVNGTSTGVYGYSAGGSAVKGNTAYDGTSSKFLKYKEKISVIEQLKNTPVEVYKYTWEDSNYFGFNEFVGPLAEDIYDAFKLTSHKDSMFTVDGIALGLGIELLDEVDHLKDKIRDLELKLEKLLNKEGDK